jgi:hypothetical protein
LHKAGRHTEAARLEADIALKQYNTLGCASASPEECANLNSQLPWKLWHAQRYAESKHWHYYAARERRTEPFSGSFAHAAVAARSAYIASRPQGAAMANTAAAGSAVTGGVPPVTAQQPASARSAQAPATPGATAPTVHRDDGTQEMNASHCVNARAVPANSHRPVPVLAWT